jgi:predicted ribosome quality control (RQC) complex YloA/Tae2 family protein
MTQALDALTLKMLARDWATFLDGAKIAKVSQPSAYEFTLGFWGGATREQQRDFLYIHLNPQMPFAVLLSNKDRQKDDHRITLNTFSKPTALCMLLRKHLNGAVLHSVQTLPQERVLNLLLDNYNELGQRVRLVLSLELMGKHTNMILYEEQSATMLAVAHGVSESMSRHREVAASLPYAPPPTQEGKLPLAEHTAEDWAHLWQTRPPKEAPVRYLSRRLAGWGQDMLQATLDALAPELADQSELSPERIESLRLALLKLEAGENLAPATLENPPILTAYTSLPNRNQDSKNAPSHEKQSPHSSHQQVTSLTNPGKPYDFTLLTFPQQAAQRLACVNDMLAAYYIPRLTQERLDREKEKILTALQRREERLDKRRAELSDESPVEIAQWQAQGDRLLAAYGSGEVQNAGPQGQSEVCLLPYGDEPEWHIKVDGALSWIENANRYYRRAKKAKARLSLKKSTSETLDQAQAFLADLRQLAMQADTLTQLTELDLELQQVSWQAPNPEAREPQKPLLQSKNPKQAKNIKGKKHAAQSKSQKKNSEESLPSGVMSIRSSDGTEILVGKTAKGNDVIVGKLSRSDDIWLHVHQMPGSHVLLRAGSEAPQSQTLEEAAMLSAYYSVARQSLNVPVIYTQCRYVKKIPHSYPGHVTYRQEKTLFISPNPTQVEALLSGRLSPEPTL